ncbi:MAG TPA: hypothetical protein VFQ92_20970 [Blastocatellia bacterium]|nr:hypothetical protein [Blastocatellia bacterium]
MVAGFFRFIHWGAVFGLMALIFIQIPLPHSEGKGSAGSASENAQESSRFIVAFELCEENGFNFTWPFEPMRPAPYEKVLMVVEKMPRVQVEKNGGESEPLVASHHLKINGRRQKPYRITNKHTYFLVNLNQGRLRLSLSIPPGFTLDRQHKTASIKLYEFDDS